jgi:hypothetical protein
MDENNTQLDVTIWFRDFVEANRGYFPTDHYQMLNSVAEMLNDFKIQASEDFLTVHNLVKAQYDAQDENKRLMEWCEGVEADNDTLRGEIRRLKEDQDLLRRDYEEMRIAMSERGN